MPVLLLLRRRNRFSLHELLVASQAAIGGPSTALALAAGLDRDDLAVPGVALGLLGYVIGTYLGVAVAAWLVDISEPEILHRVISDGSLPAWVEMPWTSGCSMFSWRLRGCVCFFWSEQPCGSVCAG